MQISSHKLAALRGFILILTGGESVQIARDLGVPYPDKRGAMQEEQTENIQH
jgi:hypothetical protein